MAIRFRVAWDCRTGWVVAAVNEADRENGFVGPVRFTDAQIGLRAYDPYQDDIVAMGAAYDILPEEIEVIL